MELIMPTAMNTIMSTAIRMKRPTGMGGAKPGEAAS